MESITTTVYRSEDGTIFLKKSECEAYEAKKLHNKALDEIYKEKEHFEAFIRIMSNLQDICYNGVGECELCPFNSVYYPETTFEHITQDCLIKRAFGSWAFEVDTTEIQKIF